MSKKLILTHPLDDDGFVNNAIDELTKITNKWNLVIESDSQGNTYLVFRDEIWSCEEKYKIKYDHEKRKYI